VSGRARQAGALAFSAALHLALFAALVATVRPAPPRPSLEVRLVQLFSPTAPGGGEPPADVPTEPVSNAQRRRAPARLTPAPAVSTALPTAAPLALAAGVEGQTPPGGGKGGPGRADPAEGNAGGGSASLLGELHRRLSEAATRCYPPAARRLRLRGEVPLRFCLDAAGSASALSLEGSTGSPVLDRSALECVVPGAAPLPGVVGCFQVAVRFGG
jgi:periplasmic protein TonB